MFSTVGLIELLSAGVFKKSTDKTANEIVYVEAAETMLGDVFQESESRGDPEARKAPMVRVFGFVDGFNLYHALEYFRRGNTDAERTRYRQYKWLSLAALLKRYLDSNTEELCGIKYFTAYPPWDDAKRFRHETYVSALGTTGVETVFGHFKLKAITCRATCKQEFQMFEEKETDVNISISMLSSAESFDKAILVTEDSDQGPAVKLLRKLHPEKQVFNLAPVGRRSKDLEKVCNGKLTMTEDALIASQFPNLIPILRGGKQVALIVKPHTW